MRDPELRAYKQRLDGLFEMTRLLPEEQAQLRAHWARYLCVVTSGLLETAVRVLYVKHARARAHKSVADFVDSHLTQFSNAKMDAILAVARRFSPEWESELRAATEGELKDAVDSIVSNRHLIAHGRNVGISCAVVERYYASAVKVIDLIEEQCGT
jgi:hypothetical protein